MSQAIQSPSYDELSIAERIELLQQLWDDLTSRPEEIELTDAQRAELDRRLEEYRRDPSEGVAWDTLRNSLLATP